MVSGIAWWLCLFPLTYAVHIVEEGLAGERFYRWIERIPLACTLHIHVTGTEFVVANGACMIAMLVAVTINFISPSTGWWVVPALGTLVAVNGLGHAIGSLMTRSFSPGLVSGLFLWLPLGTFAIFTSHNSLTSSEFWTGAFIGVAAQAAVAAILLLMTLFKRHYTNQSRTAR